MTLFRVLFELYVLFFYSVIYLIMIDVVFDMQY